MHILGFCRLVQMEQHGQVDGDGRVVGLVSMMSAMKSHHFRLMWPYRRRPLGVVDLDVARLASACRDQRWLWLRPPCSWIMSIISGHSSLCRRSYSSSMPGYSFILVS